MDNNIQESQRLYNEARKIWLGSKEVNLKGKKFAKLIDMLIRSSRMGNSDAVVFLSIFWGDTLAKSLKTEAAELIGKFLGEGLDASKIGCESLRDYLEFEASIGKNAIREALVKQASQDNVVAMEALELCPRLLQTEDAMSLSRSLENCFINLDYRTYYILLVSNFSRYGLLCEKNDEVADILRKRYDEATDFLTENEKDLDDEDKQAQLRSKLEIPMVLWGTPKENDAVLDWIWKAVAYQKRAKTQAAIMFFYAYCIEKLYGNTDEGMHQMMKIYEMLASHVYLPSLHKLECINDTDWEKIDKLLDEDDFLEPSDILRLKKKFFEKRKGISQLANLAHLYLHNVCQEDISPDIPEDQYSLYQKLYVLSKELQQFKLTPSSKTKFMLDKLNDGFPPAILFADEADKDIIGTDEFERLCDEVVKPYLGIKSKPRPSHSDTPSPSILDTPPPMDFLDDIPY